MVGHRKNRQASIGKDRFYIVGPMKMQNELMAAYLEEKTGNECQVVDNIDEFYISVIKSRNYKNFLFIDCKGKDSQAIIVDLSPYMNNNHQGNRILLFNVSPDMQLPRKYVVKGIYGFLYEHDSLDNFIKAVWAVYDGKLWFPREMLNRCIFEEEGSVDSSRDENKQLTERQVEVLAMIAIGATNEEISEKLCISPHTVKTHLYRIFKNINVPNRVQAALWAAKNL